MNRPGRPTKRLLPMLLLLLGGGAILNVSVAWGIAYFDRLSFDDMWYEKNEHYRTAFWQDERFNFGVHVLDFNSTFRVSLIPKERQPGSYRPGLSKLKTHADIELPSWTSAQHVIQTGKWPRGTFERITEEAQGWPMLTLMSRRYGDRVKPPVVIYYGLHVGSELMSKSAVIEPLIIPFRPIWPGFAINTIFYAAIIVGVWPVLAFPFKLRRWRRLKRGLCPACAYPVGGSPVCTECGKPVTLRSS